MSLTIKYTLYTNSSIVLILHLLVKLRIPSPSSDCAMDVSPPPPSCAAHSVHEDLSSLSTLSSSKPCDRMDVDAPIQQSDAAVRNDEERSGRVDPAFLLFSPFHIGGWTEDACFPRGFIVYVVFSLFVSNSNTRA